MSQAVLGTDWLKPIRWTLLVHFVPSKGASFLFLEGPLGLNLGLFSHLILEVSAQRLPPNVMAEK